MSDNKSDSKSERSSVNPYTSSSRRVDHTYVRIQPKAMSATLSMRAANSGQPFDEICSGKVTCKFVESEKTMCVVVSPPGASEARRLPIHARLEITRQGDDKHITWVDVTHGGGNGGAECRLVFANVASRDSFWGKMKKARDICNMLGDTDARVMWFSNFGLEEKVAWKKFFNVFAKVQQLDAAPVEEKLRGSMIGLDVNATPEALDVFLKWYGPYANCFTKWMEVMSLPYFFGAVSREVAENTLDGQPVGSFLMRLSEPGFFAVSYVSGPVDGISDEDFPLHFRIENIGGAGYAMETAEEEIITEATISDLVASQSHIVFHPLNKRDLDKQPTPSPSVEEKEEKEELRQDIAFLSDGWFAAMRQLCQSKDHDHKLHAARLMVSWVEQEDNKYAFVTGGGLQLINLLADSTSEAAVERMAVRALCALVSNPRIKMLIIDQALPALYAFAASSDEQIQQYSAFIFANLVLNDAQVQQCLLERDCLPSLNTLSKSKSTYVQANIAWVFGNLAQHEKNKKAILLGGLQALFKMAQSENDKVKKYAFDALGCLGIVDGDDVGKLIAQVKQSLDPKPVWEIDYNGIEDLRLVDSGGYGNVYTGKYLHMRVAVKMLKKSQIRDLEAFKAEIVTISKLRHPNIVLFLGATTSPLTIVTEYCARKSMFDVIHDEAVMLDSNLVLKMARDTALGMSYLHSLNIIHRDLKSLNLLINEGFSVKIADFGLSRVLHNDATMTPHGTYAWRPPEMFRGDPYDHRVDVYSYGIVLWELFTRDIPFDSMSYEDIKKAVLANQRPHLPPTRDPIFEELVGLMQACWQNDPKLRPSFDDICVGLEEVAAVLTGGK